VIRKHTLHGGASAVISAMQLNTHGWDKKCELMLMRRATASV